MVWFVCWLVVGEFGWLWVDTLIVNVITCVVGLGCDVLFVMLFCLRCLLVVWVFVSLSLTIGLVGGL